MTKSTVGVMLLQILTRAVQQHTVLTMQSFTFLHSLFLISWWTLRDNLSRRHNHKRWLLISCTKKVWLTIPMDRDRIPKQVHISACSITSNCRQPLCASCHYCNSQLLGIYTCICTCTARRICVITNQCALYLYTCTIRILLSECLLILL